MISKEVMEVKYTCEIKMNKLFIEAANKVKEILTAHKCDGKVYNKRITDMVFKELGIPQFCAVTKDASSKYRYMKLYLNNNERYFDNGKGIKGYVERESVLGLDIIVDLQNERIKLAETLESLDKVIERYKQNIANMEDYMTNYDTYKAYEDKFNAAMEEYRKKVPSRLRMVITIVDNSY